MPPLPQAASTRLSATALQVAGNANSAVAAANQADTSAQEGKYVVADTQEAMRKLMAVRTSEMRPSPAGPATSRSRDAVMAPVA